MAKRKPTGKDHRTSMDRDAFWIDEVTKEVERAVFDSDSLAKLDEILQQVQLGRYSYNITYNTTTNVIEYYTGGLSGTLVATLTLTYQNARKKKIVSGEWG